MTREWPVTKPLTAEMAAQAYPLVRELSGAGSLADWLRFVDQHMGNGGRGGIIVCELGTYIRGLFGWETTQSVGCRRQLVVRHFTVPAVLPPRIVIDALLDSVEKLAEGLECEEIEIEMPLFATLHPAFAERGLLPGSLGLHKLRRPAPGRSRPDA